VSPGCAPSTAIGPFTWSTLEKSSVARSATVDTAVSWPLPASSMSSSITEPDSTLSMGGTLVSFEWPRPGLPLRYLNR